MCPWAQLCCGAADLEAFPKALAAMRLVTTTVVGRSRRREGQVGGRIQTATETALFSLCSLRLHSRCSGLLWRCFRCLQVIAVLLIRHSKGVDSHSALPCAGYRVCVLSRCLPSALCGLMQARVASVAGLLALVLERSRAVGHIACVSQFPCSRRTSLLRGGGPA